MFYTCPFPKPECQATPRLRRKRAAKRERERPNTDTDTHTHNETKKQVNIAHIFCFLYTPELCSTLAWFQSGTAQLSLESLVVVVVPWVSRLLSRNARRRPPKYVDAAAIRARSCLCAQRAPPTCRHVSNRRKWFGHRRTSEARLGKRAGTARGGRHHPAPTGTPQRQRPPTATLHRHKKIDPFSGSFQKFFFVIPPRWL
jgi:hypothetical protein